MKKTSKALVSTAALCLVLSTSSVFAAENTTVAPERLAGSNRVNTAIKIAEKSFNNTWKGSGKAILSAAADANLVDSLAVAPLSYQLKAPILLNDAKDTINAETLKALKNNKVNTVYIATGEGVISNKAKAQLEKEGIKVERLGGKNRYETAKNILDAFKKNGGETKNVALVSGTGLADALSVAPQAAKTGMPIILTNGKDAVAANLQEVAKAADKVYAIGGNGVISDALVQQLKADRVSGQSRYETNAAVIKKFAGDKEFSKIYLGNGQDSHLVDSLTGSVLAAQSGSPIVLADKNLADATKDALKGKISDKTAVVALGGEAVVSNGVVKEVEDAAKAEINKVAAESVVSLNETSVQVKGFAKDTKEADLKDKKIELKAGDVTLTAKYVASSLTEDGKANFVLENNKKLVDATEYTVESDWAEFVVNKFMAKVSNAYVKTINVTTKAVQGKANNKVYFAAKNQYGEEIDLNGKVANVKATATINGVPVKADEISTADINNGYVTIVKPLKEGDKVVINFTNKIADKDVQVGTASFTAVKAEDSVATTISDMKAEYTNVAANGHELNKEAKEVLPDDQVKLSVKILDQFGNPMADGTTARWVVESGKDLVTKIDGSAIDEVSDVENFTLKAIKAGDLKISAFLSNGKKVTYEVKIGAKQLSELNIAPEAGVNLASVAGLNHEEKIIGVVTPNAGAILTPGMIKFDIKATKTSEEVKASDVQVVAKLRGGDKDNKNDIVISVKSSKVGKYVITPYVGESVEKSVKGNITTVITTIDQTVASIDDINFDAAELKVGSEVKKDIVFRNKYKEVVVLNDGQAKVSVTPGIADATNNAKVTKDADKNKNVLTLKVDGAKTYNVVVENGDVIKAFNLTFKEPAFTAVELGNDINGVVAGDPADKAKYQTVKFLDQDGKAMAVNKENIKVSVTKPDGQPLANIADLITLGKTYTVNEDGVVKFEAAANNEDNVVALKVAPTANVVAGTYTVKVESQDGKIVDTLNITVGAKRISKTVDVKPASTKVVFGGKTKVTIVPKDQYGEFIAVGADKVEVLPGTNFTAGSVTAINKDGGSVDADHKVAAYQVELTGKSKGTNDVVVNVKEGDKVLSTNKVSMTVDSAASLIDSVAVNTKDIKALYSTETKAANVDLNAIVKAADGTVIPVSQNDLDWKVISQKDSEGKEVTTRTVNVDSKTGVVTANKNTVGSAVVEVTTANMKKATITLKFDDKASVAQKETVKVINTAKDDQNKILPLDADDKTEGIQVALDNDKKDGEENGAVKVELNAKDQYDNLLGADKTVVNDITLRVGDATVVEAKKDDKGAITITAKGEGDSKVYVEYAGQTITLDVKANKAAVDSAAAKAAADADAAAKAAAEKELNVELAKVSDSKELAAGSTVDASTLNTAYGIDNTKVTLAVDVVDAETNEYKVTLTHKTVTTVKADKTVTVTVAK
ncbi:cell wall-binding repeat-containing protein [Clostridium botulinum]|nr:cell wall-binding repeat-containing protein [Clostridium botulinum]